jgi:hypothetical protein
MSWIGPLSMTALRRAIQFFELLLWAVCCCMAPPQPPFKRYQQGELSNGSKLTHTRRSRTSALRQRMRLRTSRLQRQAQSERHEDSAGQPIASLYYCRLF